MTRTPETEARRQYLLRHPTTELIRELITEYLTTLPDHMLFHDVSQEGVVHVFAEMFGIDWVTPPKGELRFLYAAIDAMHEDGEVELLRTSSDKSGSIIKAIQLTSLAGGPS